MISTVSIKKKILALILLSNFSPVKNGPHKSAYKYSHGCSSMYIGLGGSNCDKGVTACQNRHIFTKSSTSLFILDHQKDSQKIHIKFSQFPNGFGVLLIEPFYIGLLVARFSCSLKESYFAHRVFIKFLKRDINSLSSLPNCCL